MNQSGVVFVPKLWMANGWKKLLDNYLLEIFFFFFPSFVAVILLLDHERLFSETAKSTFKNINIYAK